MDGLILTERNKKFNPSNPFTENKNKRMSIEQRLF